MSKQSPKFSTRNVQVTQPTFSAIKDTAKKFFVPGPVVSTAMSAVFLDLSPEQQAAAVIKACALLQADQTQSDSSK